MAYMSMKIPQEKQINNDLTVFDWEDFKQLHFREEAAGKEFTVSQLKELMNSFYRSVKSKEANVYEPNHYVSLVFSHFFKENEWHNILKDLKKRSEEEIITSDDFLIILEKETIGTKIMHCLSDGLEDDITNEEIENVVEMVMVSDSIKNGCFDYIESAGYSMIDGKRYVYMCIFVEPNGHVVLQGETFNEVTNAWKKIFTTQPDNTNYIEAGSYIYEYNNDYENDEQVDNIVGVNVDLDNFWGNIRKY